MTNDPDWEIAHAWIRLQQAGGKSDADFWSFMALHRLVRRDPDRAWNVIKQILQLAEDDEVVLSCVAAGPLEDLLVIHGRSWIDRVEYESKRSETFRRTLGGVWTQGSMDEAVWKRVQDAALGDRK